MGLAYTQQGFRASCAEPGELKITITSYRDTGGGAEQGVGEEVGGTLTHHSTPHLKGCVCRGIPIPSSAKLATGHLERAGPVSSGQGNGKTPLLRLGVKLTWPMDMFLSFLEI